MASAFDKTFGAAIQSFFDEPESINPHEAFEIFFNAFQAKKKLSLEEIDNELGDIMEQPDIPVGLNQVICDFLEKNAEMEVKKIAIKKRPASTPMEVDEAPASVTPVEVPAPVTPAAVTPVPVTPATSVEAPATSVEAPATSVEAPATSVEVPATSVEVPEPVTPATISPAPVVAERKVKLAEVIGFVRKNRDNGEYTTLVNFPVPVSNNLQPENETHKILSNGLNLSEYVGTTVAFHELIEDIISKFPTVKNNMTQSAMIQGLIGPDDRERVKAIYQGFNIARPEKTIKRKAEDAAEETPEEPGTKAKRTYKKRAPAKNVVGNNDRIMVTLDMMYRQIGTMHELLGNLLQGHQATQAQAQQVQVQVQAQASQAQVLESDLEA